MDSVADATRRLTYGDWLTLNTKLLGCYDHVVRPPFMAVYDLKEWLGNRRVGAWLVPSGWAVEGYSNCAAWLVRSGWAQVQYAERTFRADPGQWLIVSKGERIQSFADPAHLLSLAFVAEWPDREPLLKHGMPIVLDARDHKGLERQARKLVRLVNLPADRWNTRRESLDYGAFLDLSAAWFGWFHELLNVTTAHGVTLATARSIDTRVIQATRLLDANPMDSPLDQEQLAADVGLSLSQLIRIFQRDLHTTPRQYFETRRLTLAQDRLCPPNARTKEVAYSLGFKSLAHFSRWFKQRTGISPREYVRTR